MEPPSHSPIKVTSTQYPLQAAGPVRLQPTLPTTPNPSGALTEKNCFRIRPNGKYGYFWGKQGRGYPQRLTTHSGNETPVAYKDAGHILFLANIMPTAEDAQFPSGQFQQVYEVNTEGGRPILFSSMPMEDISINHTGNTLLYHDKKDMKTLGVNITLHPLPAIFGCVLWMETVPFANKLLSMVRTALPFGLQMINHSII